LNHFSLILVKLCKFDEAMDKAKLALDGLLKTYRELHPDVSRSFNALGAALRAQGNFKQAIEYHQKALEIRMKIYGELHEEVAESYYEIANSYLIQGLYKEAQEYCLKCENLTKQIFGEEHPMTVLAQVHVKAAYIYLNKQEFGENPSATEDILIGLERLLNLQKALIGEDHIDLCLTYIVLGNCCRYKRKYVEGINYFLKALEIADKNKDDYMAAYIHRYLAFIYKMHGGIKEALYHSNKGLRIWSKFPLLARNQAFSDPDFFAHSIGNLKDINSAMKYAQKANQVVFVSKNEQWSSLAQGAVKTFEKKVAKYELMRDNLF